MLANLRALFGVLLDIVLLRRGPENLPASPALLAFTMALYALVAGFVAHAVAAPGQNWAMELAVVLVTTPIWYRVALQLANKRERFLQTATAMFAVMLLFAPLAIPVVNAVQMQVQAYETTQVPPSAALTLLMSFLLVWRLIVFVRIVRAAFEWTAFPAVLLVLAQEFAMLIVLLMLSGAPAQQG